MTPDALDVAVRQAAFDFIRRSGARQGEQWPVIGRELLAQGFLFNGKRVPLLGPQGIFKPAILDIPLSITTVPPSERKARPYEDRFTYDCLVYRYRGDDPNHRDNEGLRRAKAERTPLIYFHGLVPGRYLAIFPAFVAGDDRNERSFAIAFEAAISAGLETAAIADAPEQDDRAYALRLMKVRLHQEAFRQRLVRAYRSSCAVCHLRHEELLDVAHILPDGHPRGLAVLPNGVLLCKMHHAAFDANILGIRPDHRVEIRPDVLTEIDGPMLQHGLKGAHGVQIWTPPRVAERPSESNLQERYDLFRNVA